MRFNGMHPARPLESMLSHRWQGTNESLGSLKVYDVKGHLIKTLFQGNVMLGIHEIVWDGTNHFGMPVSGGIYFANLELGTHSVTRKMILLK